MLLPGVARRDTVVLVDTNVVMEAVRTRCGNAVAGGLRLETVEERREEALRGDRGRAGYQPVSEQDLARIHVVHPVSAVERAAFAMAYESTRRTWIRASATCSRTPARLARGDALWIACSADKACVRAAVALGWHERMHSLGALAAAVGAHPHPPLLQQHTELSRVRTGFLLAP